MKGRILVVDDNKNICILLKELFLLDDHIVKISTDIEEIDKILSSFVPDLCIFDINVGSYDILDFANKLKEIYPHIKCIFMSADEPNESYKDQIFIRKPFDLFKLRDFINTKLEEIVV